MYGGGGSNHVTTSDWLGDRPTGATEASGKVCSDSSATPSFPSQPEGKIGLPRANPRGRLTSRRGLTPRGSLECNPEVPAFPGEEYEVPDTRLGEVSSALQ